MNIFGIFATLCLVVSLTNGQSQQWSTQTLKCKQWNTGGVKETTFQYVRSYADNTCSIYKTEKTEGHEAIHQDHSDGHDCSWEPLCYKKSSSHSSDSKYSPTPISHRPVHHPPPRTHYPEPVYQPEPVYHPEPVHHTHIHHRPPPVQHHSPQRPIHHGPATHDPRYLGGDRDTQRLVGAGLVLGGAGILGGLIANHVVNGK